MEPSSQSRHVALATTLVERVALILVRRRGVRLDDAARESVRTAVLAVLEDTEVAVDGIDLARLQDNASLVSGEFDGWITHRVERALRLGLSVACRALDLPDDLEPPRVLVRRSGDLGTPTSPPASDTIEGALGGELPEGADELGLLILADGAELDRVLQSYPEMDVGGRDLAVHFRCLAGDETVALGKDTAGGVQLFDLSTALHGMQRTLVQIAARHRRESSSAGTSAGRAPLVGRLLDNKYRVRRQLGRGGFGSVYEAEDVTLGTHVAIKVLETDRGLSQSERESFRAEARRLTRLSNPHTVDWKSFQEEADGTCYLVMELLEGEPLDALLRRERTLEPRRAARLVLQVLDALRAAHHLGDGTSVLHLDLKPANVFVLPAQAGVREERAKVIDFGIGQYVGGASIETRAQPAAALPAGSVEHAPGDDDAAQHSIRVTADLALERALPAGMRRCVACTPEYASPEQCAHVLGEGELAPLDGRSDLYSLGVMAYQMLTGELPFERPAARGDWLRLHRREPPRPLRDVAPRVPRGLARWVMRCLSKEPDRRWRDSREAHDALRRWLQPSTLRQAALIATPLVVMVGAAGLTLRGGGEAALEPFVEEAGSLRRLGGERLWMGPEHASATLRIDGWDATRAPSELRLVKAPRDDAPALAGFAADWDESGSLELRASGGDALTSSTVYVALEDDDGDTRYSRPFELTWLPSAAWSLDAVVLPGGGALPIDPSGAWLEVALSAPADALRGVVVEFDARVIPCQLDGVAGGARARLSLEALRAGDGAHRLTVVATDRAGGTHVEPLEISCVSGALTLDAALVAGAPLDRGLTLPPDAPLTLDLRCSSPAALRWHLRAADGSTLAEGALPAAREQQLRLPDPRTLDVALPFSGVLELEFDDHGQVARASAERGRAARRLDVHAPADLPELHGRLSAGAGFADLTPLRPLHVSGERATLQLTRDAPSAIEVGITLVAPDGSEVPQAVSWRDPARDVLAFELDLPREGTYRLDLASAWVGASGGDSQVFEVVVDRSAPRLDARAADGRLTLVPDAAPPELELECADTSPVALEWRLVDARGRELGSGRTSDAPVDAGPQRLDAPLPDVLADARRAPQEAARELDGTYALRLTAVDLAGNRSTSVDLPLEVALSGPELELVVPAPRLEWSTDGEGLLELRARAADANGTAWVRCEVLDGERPHASVDLARVGDERSARWEGRLRPGASWSGRELQLRLEAADGLGRTTRLESARLVGTVVERLPARVRVTVGDVELQPMLLVRGNARAAYVFGGRHDSEEEALFRSLGLGPFNELATERAWHVEYARGEIGDYYLDEREVGVGEFLDFLRAEGGWDARAHWPAGSQPTAERRAELEQRLARLEPELPVTGVTWEEAAAYAAWAGKRLPSWVEWEYALREGTHYRAGAEGLAPWPSNAPAGPSPRGATRESDARAGPRDLGTNVAEWTLNPFSFEPDGARPDDLAAHARAWRAAWLAPDALEDWDRAARYWVVGGSFRGPQADFTRVTPRRRGWSGEDVGFRCALSADAATAALESNDARVRVREDGR